MRGVINFGVFGSFRVVVTSRDPISTVSLAGPLVPFLATSTPRLTRTLVRKLNFSSFSHSWAILDARDAVKPRRQITCVFLLLLTGAPLSNVVLRVLMCLLSLLYVVVDVGFSLQESSGTMAPSLSTC